MRANYAACYGSNQDIARMSGWIGQFYFFCVVRKMALVCWNAHDLSTLRDISDR